MNMKQLPMLSTDLVEQLDTAFPHRTIQPGQTFDEAMYYAGKRALVDYLIELQTAGQKRAAKL
jgi:hypothetical protein